MQGRSTADNEEVENGRRVLAVSNVLTGPLFSNSRNFEM